MEGEENTTKKPRRKATSKAKTATLKKSVAAEEKIEDAQVIETIPASPKPVVLEEKTIDNSDLEDNSAAEETAQDDMATKQVNEQKDFKAQEAEESGAVHSEHDTLSVETAADGTPDAATQKDPSIETSNDSASDSQAAPVAPAAPAKSSNVGAFLTSVVVAVGLVGMVQFFDQGWPFNAGAGQEEQQEAIAAEVEKSQTQTRAEISALADQVSALQENQAAQNAQGAAVSETLGTIDALSAQMQDIEAQLADLKSAIEQTKSAVAETQSALSKVETSLAATDAPEKADLEALRTEFSDLFSTVEGVQSIISEQQALRQVAEERSRFAEAMRQAEVALEEGASFSSAVGALDALGVPVSDELRLAAQSGSQTRQELRDGYAQMAREALALDRQVALQSDQEASGFMTFFKNQIGLRSVTVREGDDVDAILSRAEEAVKRDDLEMALSELSLIQGPAQQAVLPWLEAGQARLALEGALAQLEFMPVSE